MYKVARDAAALASRPYYSRESAAATIPTKVRKPLEMADNGAELRNTWHRTEPHISGALGMVFKSLFELDEYSKGAEVRDMFALLGGKGYGDNSLCELAAAFMKEALEGQRALLALEEFAEVVRMGRSTEDALLEAIQQNPELFR